MSCVVRSKLVAEVEVEVEVVTEGTSVVDVMEAIVDVAADWLLDAIVVAGATEEIADEVGRWPPQGRATIPIGPRR